MTMQNGASKYTFGDISRKLSPTYVEVTPSEKVAMKVLLTQAVPIAFDHRRGGNLTQVTMNPPESGTTDLTILVNVAERIKSAIDEVVEQAQNSLD